MALLDTLEGFGEDTTNFRNLVDLNSFAVQYRYETLDTDDEPLDRASQLKEIEELFAQVTIKVFPDQRIGPP